MKHIPRFYVCNTLSASEEVTIGSEQMRHAHLVLRLSVGDNVRVFNSDCGEWNCIISDVTKNKVICQNIIKTPEPENGTSVVCSLIHPNRLAIMLEKITELGVTDIVPIITQYTQYKDINKRKAQQIIIQASEQSRRITIPRLHDVVKLPQFLNEYSNNQRLLVGDERLHGSKLHEVLSEHCSFLVGPEGGFSEDEYRLFDRYDFIRLFYFGNNILRSETAAISFVATWNSRFL